MNDERLYDKRLARREEKLKEKAWDIQQRMNEADEKLTQVKEEQENLRGIMLSFNTQNKALNEKSELIEESYRQLNELTEQNDKHEKGLIDWQAKINASLQSIAEREKTYEMESLELKVRQKEITRREKLISLKDKLNA